AGGFFLAEPVVVSGEGLPPYLPGPDFRDIQPFQPYYGTLISGPSRSRRELTYDQVAVPPGERGLRPGPADPPPDYLPALAPEAVPDMRDWTNELLEQLAARGAGGLTAGDLRREAAGAPPRSPAAPAPDGPARLLPEGPFDGVGPRGNPAD